MKRQWLILAVLFPIEIFSQENSSKTRLHTIASVGMVAGQSTAKPLFQAEAGIFYDRLFTGLGIGLDHYRFRSIPLYIDGRMHFGKSKSVFVYGSGGYNFPYNNKSEDGDWFKTTDRFVGGFYLDAGLGYRVKFTSGHHVILSAGYSRKDVVNKVGYTYLCFSPPCEEVVYNYHYNLGRIITKLSWEFGR